MYVAPPRHHTLNHRLVQCGSVGPRFPFRSGPDAKPHLQQMMRDSIAIAMNGCQHQSNHCTMTEPASVAVKF
jgi:hypothetical protein